jgi:hypothetical protein
MAGSVNYHGMLETGCCAMSCHIPIVRESPAMWAHWEGIFYIFSYLWVSVRARPFAASGPPKGLRGLPANE